ncbi:hypothetical protein ADUPG1_009474, partial [Aduncisulcus paluster]
EDKSSQPRIRYPVEPSIRFFAPLPQVLLSECIPRAVERGGQVGERITHIKAVWWSYILEKIASYLVESSPDHPDLMQILDHIYSCPVQPSSQLFSALSSTQPTVFQPIHSGTPCVVPKHIPSCVSEAISSSGVFHASIIQWSDVKDMELLMQNPSGCSMTFCVRTRKHDHPSSSDVIAKFQCRLLPCLSPSFFFSDTPGLSSDDMLHLVDSAPLSGPHSSIELMHEYE